jgi:hypothetical protein
LQCVLHAFCVAFAPVTPMGSFGKEQEAHGIRRQAYFGEPDVAVPA